MDAALPILYRDDRLIAVVKPAGLLVHKTKLDAHENQNLVDTLSAQIASPVFTVHRLDKPTSGVLVLALDSECASRLALQFEQRLVKKTYLAVVRGYAKAQDSIDYAIGDKDAKHKPRVSAVTHYRTCATLELPYFVDRYPTSRYSLVEVNPVTGRRHQIRQHMKHSGHPLVGDTSYGKTTHNRFFAKHYQCNRLLLHATQLSLTHPYDNQPVTFKSNPSDSNVADAQQYRRVLDDAGWQWLDEK